MTVTQKQEFHMRDVATILLHKECIFLIVIKTRVRE